ncbi:hypothetical protein EK904_014871, partial [Melospiza melodia maxima]
TFRLVVPFTPSPSACSQCCCSEEDAVHPALRIIMQVPLMSQLSTKKSALRAVKSQNRMDMTQGTLKRKRTRKGAYLAPSQLPSGHTAHVFGVAECHVVLQNARQGR